MTTTSLPCLSLLEARVLGVLIEKQRTVPDSYPLTLNALLAGCNQKSSRDPVLNATEAEVQVVIDRLKGLSLVIESSGGRVMRYAHNAGRVLQIPMESVALLAALILRGPQTAGELRINCDRLQRFVDISAVEGFLNELAERPVGALVVELPRQPGSRENRWAHLLAGTPAFESANMTYASDVNGDSVTIGELAALKANVARLEDDMAELKATVAKLCAELGVSEAKHSD
jgi:uncharacterized protein YceH (UPF0502 family)